MDSKRRSSLRFWMEVNGAISTDKLNKICSTEGLTFNLCISFKALRGYSPKFLMEGVERSSRPVPT